jgi:lipopolysaccharide export system permease protein
MLVIDKYIGKQVLFFITVVTASITMLFIIFTFLDEIQGVKNQYTTLDAFLYTLGIAPRTIYEILPTCIMLGSLIGLGLLSSNSELTILRASGWSIGRIGLSACFPILMLVVFAYLLGEFIAPYYENKVQTMKIIKQQTGKMKENSSHLWYKEGDNFIYVENVSIMGVVSNVEIFTFNDDNILQTSRKIESASFDNNQWIANNITDIKWNDNELLKTQTQQAIWQTNLTPALFTSKLINPARLSISSLYQYANYLERQNLDNSRYKLAFWSKIGQPLLSIPLLFLSLSFVFGSFRTVSLGQRLITGILIGFVFKIMQDFLQPFLLIYNLHPVLIVIIPIVVCLIVNTYLFKKI